MNYLAHLVLSEPSPEGWAGAVLGDFARGRLDDARYDHWPDALRRSVQHHRAVDAYTDAHPVHLRSRDRFAPPLRRFAGIVVDLGYDHFLAASFKRHTGGDLSAFADEVYAGLASQRRHMPPPAQALCERMRARDWLRTYARPESMSLAFAGVSRRLRRQPNALAQAGPAFAARYGELAADFDAFYPELEAFARPAS